MNDAHIEAAICTIGNIVTDNDVLDFLPCDQLIDMLISHIGNSDFITRGTSIWALSKFIPVLAENQTFLEQYIRAMINSMKDEAQTVQQAACAAIAELMENKGDCAVLFDTNNMDMKVVNTVYRSIITKRNKKKEKIYPEVGKWEVDEKLLENRRVNKE